MKEVKYEYDDFDWGLLSAKKQNNHEPLAETSVTSSPNSSPNKIGIDTVVGKKKEKEEIKPEPVINLMDWSEEKPKKQEEVKE